MTQEVDIVALVRSKKGTQRLIRIMMKTPARVLGMKSVEQRRWIRELTDRSERLDREIKQARVDARRRPQAHAR